MNKNKLIIHFQGEREINLKTLSRSLQGLNSALDGLKKYVDTESNTTFEVDSISPGSFSITLVEVVGLVQNTLPLLDNAVSALAGLKELLKLRKCLNGKPPESVKKEGVNVVITGDGNSVSISNEVYYAYRDDQKIERGLARISRAVSTDSSRDGIEFDFDINDDRSAIVYSEDDLIATSKALPLEAQREEKTTITSTVGIRKVNFQRPTSKWELLFLGKSIEAEIVDEDWLNRFSAGDIDLNAKSKMSVKMDIYTVGETVIRYVITEILDS